MREMITTDWGSYLIPENRVQEFKQSKELFDCMDTLNTIKEKHFDETWGDYKIIPARPIW